MLEYHVGSYKKQEGDIILDKFHPIYPNALNENNTFIIFDDDKLDKQAIEFMKESKLLFKIIAQDKSMVKGMRNSKTLKISEELGKVNINPFELALDILTCKDRNYLKGFLLEHRPSLYIPVKYLSCNINKLTEQTKKAIMWLDMHLFRVDYEILVTFISHYIKPEIVGKYDLKWNYPKKEEKAEE